MKRIVKFVVIAIVLAAIIFGGEKKEEPKVQNAFYECMADVTLM